MFVSSFVTRKIIVPFKVHDSFKINAENQTRFFGGFMSGTDYTEEI